MLEFSVPVTILDRFTTWDYVAFGVMLLCSGTLGVYCAFSGGPQNTIRQLLIGSGSLPVVPVSTSLMASFISAAYILGNAAEVYQFGTMMFMTFLSYCAMIPTAMFFYLPVFYKLGVTTAFEYLELRFGRTTRVCAVILYVIQMLIYVSISLYAPALAMSQLTGMDLWIAVSAMGVVCTIYTSIGGIKAVVYTDTFQSFFMIAALIAVIVASAIRFEGLNNVWDIAMQGRRIEFGRIANGLTDKHSLWGLFFGAFFTNLASYATNQMMVVRYMTVNTLCKARWVVFLNLPYLVLVLFLSCFCGLLAYARYATCDPQSIGKVSSGDQLLPYFVMDVLGYWTPLPGIFVAGIFAASLSSVSSGVNALASVFYVDVIALARDGIPDRTGAKIINFLGVVFGLSSIGLVAVTKQLGNVLEASQSVNSAIGGPLLGVFTAGMLFPQINTTGALWGLFASLAVSLWINVGTIVEGPIDPTLAIGTSGCPVNFTIHMTNLTDNSNVLWAYQLSSHWYSLVSFVLVFLVAMPVSLVTGSLDGSQLDPRLIRHPADILLWWMDDERRERWRFDVGENFEEGDVFEPGKSVSSVSGVRMSTTGSAARKPSFTDMEMRRRRSSVFMTPYLPEAATNAMANGSLDAKRRQSRRSTRYSASSLRSRTRKPSFTESEMMRRQSAVFMTAYMPPPAGGPTVPSTSPTSPTTTTTSSPSLAPRTTTAAMIAKQSETSPGAPPLSSFRNGRPIGFYPYPYGDEMPHPVEEAEAEESSNATVSTVATTDTKNGRNNSTDLDEHHTERF